MHSGWDEGSKKESQCSGAVKSTMEQLDCLIEAVFANFYLFYSLFRDYIFYAFHLPRPICLTTAKSS